MAHTRASIAALLTALALAGVLLVGSAGGEDSAAVAFAKSGVLGPIGQALKERDDEAEAREIAEAGPAAREERAEQREEAQREREEQEQAAEQEAAEADTRAEGS